ncbi:hypothetical protein MMYC01_206787 [Madurella mycetomatis]|uniref:Uncharacterized protein n=1 Tax=Madurella mycetomatis TaxID=100816 RepID=A0A175W323_9PEZI|nr:hypothetical protein MMYC01_206787 [Madurella mycetomatis]
MASMGPASLRLLFAAATALPCLLLFPSAASAQGQDEDLLIDCFRFDGAVSPNNTKCPNSNTCCGPTATCLSNRLCHNVNDPPDTYVRGPCAVRGWDDSCPQICTYNETGIFPRVVVCGDGSLCCDNYRQCCQDGRGIFLDESGMRVSARVTAATTSYPPVSNGLERFTQTPSTSTTSTSTSISTSALQFSETATSSPSNAPATASNSDDSIGLKVGLGLGIPLAILITACVVYFILRRRKHPHPYDATSGPFQLGPDDGHHVYAAESHAPTKYSQAMVQAGAPHPPPLYSAPYPVEIGGQTANELDAPPTQRQRYELS